MSEATCKTCPFFVMFAGEGTCRRFPPKPMMTESGGDHAELTTENPIVSSHWFCGEHPQRQRDRLAAMAMQGILADGTTLFTNESLAESAYGIADAMLSKARGETP